MDERPLLKGIGKENLQSFITEKLLLREKWYNRADITIDGLNPDIKILKTIVKKNINTLL
jgi:hypothetical protein